jgi:hypothetical protein
VFRGEALGGGDVGYGPRGFEYEVVCTRGQAQAAHCHLESAFAPVIEIGEPAQIAVRDVKPPALLFGAAGLDAMRSLSRREQRAICPAATRQSTLIPEQRVCGAPSRRLRSIT